MKPNSCGLPGGMDQSGWMPIALLHAHVYGPVRHYSKFHELKPQDLPFTLGSDTKLFGQRVRNFFLKVARGGRNSWWAEQTARDSKCRWVNFQDYAADPTIPFGWRFDKAISGGGAFGEIASHISLNCHSYPSRAPHKPGAQKTVFSLALSLFSSVHCTHSAHGMGRVTAHAPYSPAPPHFSIGKAMNTRDWKFH